MHFFDQSVHVPDHVLMRELQGEAVLLNLAGGTYFGLDQVGTRIWQALTTTPTIQAAYEALLAEYDVTPTVLLQDLKALLNELLENGLLALNNQQA